MNYLDKSATEGGDRLDAMAQSLFGPSAVDGVRPRTALFERVVDGLGALITRYRPDGAEVLRYPLVMSRAHLEKWGYLHSFPNLLGAVCCLHGDEAAIRGALATPAADGGWAAALSPTDLVLTPAACYPICTVAGRPAPMRSTKLSQ